MYDSYKLEPEMESVEAEENHPYKREAVYDDYDYDMWLERIHAREREDEAREDEKREDARRAAMGSLPGLTEEDFIL